MDDPNGGRPRQLYADIVFSDAGLIVADYIGRKPHGQIPLISADYPGKMPF
jgi:hypothetical protein